jgi:hypothetical protein
MCIDMRVWKNCQIIVTNHSHIHAMLQCDGSYFDRARLHIYTSTQIYMYLWKYDVTSQFKYRDQWSDEWA